MKHVLVIDDEPQITNFLKQGLSYLGFRVSVAESAKEALSLMQIQLPDLVVLDLMLPDLNGYKLCQRLREEESSTLPIIMLTAKDALEDKIYGLESGADDYLTKPFAFEELVARIRTSLRRVAALKGDVTNLAVGELVIDYMAHQAYQAGKVLDLTLREFELLELFMQHPGHVLSKEIIFERVWGYDTDVTEDVIKVYINYLRSKLAANNPNELIRTVRGVGYCFKPF
jgi:two-component system response regulator MprA